LNELKYGNLNLFRVNNEMEMLASFRRGEEVGFTSVFNSYFSALSYYAMRLTNDREKANDIVQEVFLRLWKKKENFTEIRSVKSYLYRSVFNLCITGSKQVKKEEKKLSEITTGEISGPTCYDKIVRAELWNEIYRTLESLPPGVAEIIRLYYIEGKGVGEIATVLNIPVYTVKSRRTRAIQRLRKMIPGYFTFHLLLLVLTSLT
jgi:RNA polymerase sigma-70 factor (family 1)